MNQIIEFWALAIRVSQETKKHVLLGTLIAILPRTPPLLSKYQTGWTGRTGRTGQTEDGHYLRMVAFAFLTKFRPLP